MTIAMPDSITPADIPPGNWGAVLGYVDGDWPTAAQLPKLFPGARIVSLTVTGGTLDADGIDCEPGNVNAAQAAAWVRRKLESAPMSRPVVYASMIGTPGYGMPDVIAELLRLGISRAQWRALSAHYTGTAHICSPATCHSSGGQPIGWTADGTQWASSYPGRGNSKIDMSELADEFFGDWVFSSVRYLRLLGVGPHSVKAAWDSPAGPAPEGVDHYQLTVRHLGADVAAPVDIPHGPNPAVYQWDGLRPGTGGYELYVRAVGAGGHASPWAVVQFRTPSS